MLAPYLAPVVAFGAALLDVLAKHSDSLIALERHGHRADGGLLARWQKGGLRRYLAEPEAVRARWGIAQVLGVTLTTVLLYEAFSAPSLRVFRWPLCILTSVVAHELSRLLALRLLLAPGSARIGLLLAVLAPLERLVLPLYWLGRRLLPSAYLPAELANQGPISQALTSPSGVARIAHDNPEPMVVVLGHGRLVVDGQVPLLELAQYLGTNLTSETGNMTVEGFIVSRVGHLPECGLVLRDEGLEFEVTERSDTRIVRVELRRIWPLADEPKSALSTVPISPESAR